MNSLSEIRNQHLENGSVSKVRVSSFKQLDDSNSRAIENRAARRLLSISEHSLSESHH